MSQPSTRATGLNFGKAAAAKRGRNPRFPYVPVIDYGQPGGVRHTYQIRNRAFTTRQEAVDHAQKIITLNTEQHERKLAIPRYRALREQCGFPRELIGTKVVAAKPGTCEQRVAGIVVKPTAEERFKARGELSDVTDCSLVEWPDGRRWQRPEDIRVVHGA